MPRPLPLVLALIRVALMTAWQYRLTAWLELGVGALNAVGVVAPLFIVYSHAPTVAGWSFPEAMLVTAFFLVYGGLVAGIVEPNLGAVVEGVRTGALDYLLVKPADAQLVVSLQRVNPSAAWEVLAGIGVGAWAMSQVGWPSPTAMALACTMLAAGIVAAYGLWLLVVCTSSWFVRVDNLRYLLSAVNDAGRWPISVYRGFARVVLTGIIPVALVTSYPAMALLGRMTAATAFSAVAIAAAMTVVSRFTWSRALRHYSSASS
jgi:ABC-2 type transport system permease protein